jgi:hypothetical protein
MNCTSKTGLQNPRQHRHECNDLLVKGSNMNAIWYSMPPLTICYTRPGLRRCVLGEQISEVENKICMDSKATRCMYVLQIPSACTSPHPNASRKVKKKNTVERPANDYAVPSMQTPCAREPSCLCGQPCRAHRSGTPPRPCWDAVSPILGYRSAAHANACTFLL